MRAFINNQARPPFIWDVASYCLEFPTGAIRHFPAGTYNEQTANAWGGAELALMTRVHSVWYAFKHLSLSQWGESERKLASSMMPKKKKPKPTRRLNFLIRRLWKFSFFASKVLFELQRNAESH